MSSSFSSDPPAGQQPLNEAKSNDDSRTKELFAILAIVLLGDLVIYRGSGYSGVAVFLVGAMGLLFFGKPLRRGHPSLWIVAGMLALVSARLVWYGSPMLVGIGFAWLIAFATALDGHKPYFLMVLTMASQTTVAGGRALWEHLLSVRHLGPNLQRRGSLNVLLPAFAFLVFSALFILANPDAVTFVNRQIQQVLNAVSDWFIGLALRPTEIIFWIAVSWITAGLLRPIVHLPPISHFAWNEQQSKRGEVPLYAAYRNMLLTVIALFAVYLTYEFYTLWTRDFPAGFYYAGYAHEGAAWLTAALALATLILSLVFSGEVQRDPRLPKLRLLAWIWSLQNLLLSLAVYNRLFIYIDFNGMTRMRIVGLFGTSAVVAGFLLVVWKIARGKDFLWLLQRQVWALAVAVYLFVLLPVDGIAVSYNVRRILGGELSASMQIGVQSLDLEGALALPPLLDCATPEIRQGVAALIAERYSQLEIDRGRRQRAGWTAYQVSDRIALTRFKSVREKWKQYDDGKERKAAIRRFYDFAYQWY